MQRAVEVYSMDVDVYHQDPHIIKMNHALQIYLSHARGPQLSHYQHLFTEKCNSIWESDRKQCDQLSLFGNECFFPVN